MQRSRYSWLLCVSFKLLSRGIHLNLSASSPLRYMSTVHNKDTRKLVVVIGATGSGKTKLSVEICKKYNGEVISTDSMQLYKGLDIATNKITVDEAQDVKHHLIGILDPLVLGYTVVHFRQHAMQAIDDIYSRGKLPVIVGGTNYYIEALLWKILVSESAPEEMSLNGMYVGLPAHYSNMTNEALHEELKRFDPEEAARTLPGRRRRVLRCLQMFHSQGKTMSQALFQQKVERGANAVGGPLRFENCIILWPNCKFETLAQRLDQRVDQMLADGLLQELVQFYDQNWHIFRQIVLGSHADTFVIDNFRKGIFQCIGFKEFEDYLHLNLIQRSQMEFGQIGRIAFDSAVSRIKCSTRHYARQQVKWIRNRCLASDRISPPIYSLDVSDLSKWTENVSKISLEIVEHFLSDTLSLCPYPPELKLAPKVRGESRLTKTCTICAKTMIGFHWKEHIDSSNHRFNVRKWNDNIREVAAVLDRLVANVSKI